ncbi:MAG: MFS transporter [Acidimicrobiia bacterium]
MGDLERQRTRLAAIFVAHGLMLATWVAHIPNVRDTLSLGEAALGLVLLVLAAGAAAGMRFAGAISARHGAHTTTKWATRAMAAALPLPLAAHNAPQLVVALIVFGASLGAMNVAMNAVGADIQVRLGRPIMSSLHALYSVGVLAGSLLAAALLELGIRPSVQAVMLAVLVTVAVQPSLPASVSSAIDTTRHVRRRTARGISVLGLIAFAAMLGEGAVLDWSGTLIHDELGARTSVAALGFGVFSVAMAVGRLAGDRFSLRLGAERLLGFGAVLAAIGLGAGLVVGQPVSVIVGLAFMGLGYANIIPVVFTAAAARGSTPAGGIGATAIFGHAGFLVGPPLIGAVAAMSSISVALGLIAIITLLISANASAVAGQT